MEKEERSKTKRSTQEEIDKKLSDGFQQMAEQLGKMNATMELMQSNFDKKFDELSTDIKREIGQIKVDQKETNETVKNLEQKVKDLETEKVESKVTLKKLQDKVTQMECKMTQTQIRIRGLPESSDCLKTTVIKIISEILEENVDEVKLMIDSVYRTSSSYAKQHNIPADVVVKLVTMDMAKRILSKQYEQPVTMGGSKLRFMRDLPRKVLQDRKKYQQLTAKLKEQEIRFRWEFPEGLTFEHNGKRVTVKTADEAKNILDEFGPTEEGAVGGILN